MKTISAKHTYYEY